MGLKNYFNLNRTGESKNKSATSKDQMPIYYQILMYVGLVLGVFFSLIFGQVENGVLNLNIDLSNILVKVFLSIVLALVITPLVYNKINPDRDSPILIQFCIFVQFGFFWNALIGNIASAI
jgi:hypothetical protein